MLTLEHTGHTQPPRQVAGVSMVPDSSRELFHPISLNKDKQRETSKKGRTRLRQVRPLRPLKLKGAPTLGVVQMQGGLCKGVGFVKE